MNKNEILEYIKENPWEICMYDEDDEDLQLAAISENAFSIRYIQNPTEKVQLKAVKKRPELIANIKRPADSIVRYIIENCKKDIIQTMNVDFDKLPDDLKLLLELEF